MNRITEVGSSGESRLQRLYRSRHHLRVTEWSNAAEGRGHATDDDMKRQTTLHYSDWLILETANVFTKPIRSTSYRVVTLAATTEMNGSAAAGYRRLPPHYLMLMVSSTDWLRTSGCCCCCCWAGWTSTQTAANRAFTPAPSRLAYAARDVHR